MAQGPTKLIKGSMVFPSLAATIINDKFFMAIPLHRQEKSFSHLGVELNRQNMSNWLMNLSYRYFIPIVDYMTGHLILQDSIGNDETSVNVLEEQKNQNGKKGWMWLYMSGRSADKQIAIYDYQANRNHEHAINFLKDYNGYLNCDGYQAYDKLENVEQVGCWAHARRKFTDVLATIRNDEDKKGSNSDIIVKLISKLYLNEKKWKNKDYDEITKLRQEHSKPIVDDIFEKTHHFNRMNLASGKFKEAIVYLVNQESKLKTFLSNGSLEIDSNFVERKIKPFTIGRKNWLFMNTIKGAKASSAIYSILESARMNNLKPYDHFYHILELLPNLDVKSENDLEKIMPWADLPKELYMQKKS